MAEAITPAPIVAQPGPVSTTPQVSVPPPLPTEMPLPHLIVPEPVTEATRKKIVNSGWCLTFSPNLRYAIGSPEAIRAAKKMQATLDEVFGKVGEKMGQYVRWVEGKPEPHLVIGAPGFLDVVEHGEINSIIHAHMIYKVVHRSKIQLDYIAMHQALADSFGLPFKQIYVFTRLSKSKETNMTDYLLKNRSAIDKHDFAMGLVDETQEAIQARTASTKGGEPSKIYQTPVKRSHQAQARQTQPPQPVAKPVAKKKKAEAVSIPVFPLKTSKKLPPPIIKPTRLRRDESEGESEGSEEGSESGSGSGSQSEPEEEAPRKHAPKRGVYGFTFV